MNLLSPTSYIKGQANTSCECVHTSLQLVRVWVYTIQNSWYHIARVLKAEEEKSHRIQFAICRFRFFISLVEPLCAFMLRWNVVVQIRKFETTSVVQRIHALLLGQHNAVAGRSFRPISRNCESKSHHIVSRWWVAEGTSRNRLTSLHSAFHENTHL